MAQCWYRDPTKRPAFPAIVHKLASSAPGEGGSSASSARGGTEPQASGANSDYEHEFTGGPPAQRGQGDGMGAPRRPRGRNGGGGIVRGERKGSFLAGVDVSDTAV